MHALIEIEETIGLILSVRPPHERTHGLAAGVFFSAKCSGTKTECKRLNRRRRRRRVLLYNIHNVYTCGVYTPGIYNYKPLVYR